MSDIKLTTIKAGDLERESSVGRPVFHDIPLGRIAETLEAGEMAFLPKPASVASIGNWQSAVSARMKVWFARGYIKKRVTTFRGKVRGVEGVAIEYTNKEPAKRKGGRK
jgi:hypothetical protein